MNSHSIFRPASSGYWRCCCCAIGHVISKDQINHHLCDWEQDIGVNAIEVYVHRLRRKLEPTGIIIRTIRGLGYLLEKPQFA